MTLTLSPYEDEYEYGINFTFQLHPIHSLSLWLIQANIIFFSFTGPENNVAVISQNSKNEKLYSAN